jgi:hypothetical protein
MRDEKSDLGTFSDFILQEELKFKLLNKHKPKKISPEKVIKSADRGMRNLHPRIVKLRKESYKLEMAYNKLWAIKSQAQLKITPIQVITSNKKTNKKSQLELENQQLRTTITKMEAQMKGAK